MPQLLKSLTVIPAVLAAFSLFALMVLTFADVMLRSLFNAPIEITADLTRVFMALMVFSVLPTLSARGGQISVDLMDGIFSRWKLSRWRDGIVNLACGVMLIWPTERIWVLAERSRSYGDVMEYLGTPLHYVGWFIAVMTGLTALVLILRGALFLIAPKLLEAQE